MATDGKLILSPRRWYAWQVIPGDPAACGLRPCTPAFVTEVTPLKSGKGILRLSLVAALYPAATRRQTVDLRVAVHRPDHLVGTFLDASGEMRTAVVREIDLPWLALYCPEFFHRFPPDHFVMHELGFSTKVDDAATYLREAFGDTEDRVLHGTTEVSHGTKAHPMPKANTTVRLDRAFSEFDALLIRRGFRPRQMEEKWFMYCKGDRLLMRRSWTGLLIYDVALEQRGDMLWATEAA